MKAVYKPDENDELVQIKNHKTDKYVIINKTQGHIVGVSKEIIPNIKEILDISEAKNTIN